MPDVKLIVSNHCGPCQRVLKAYESGNPLPGVSLVKIEDDLDAAMELIERHNLDKVPTAVKGDTVCQIYFDEKEGVFVNCGGETEAVVTPK